MHAHMHNAHDMHCILDQWSVMDGEKATTAARKECPHCTKTFCDAKGVKRHVKKAHEDHSASAQDGQDGKMKCTNCDSR